MNKIAFVNKNMPECSFLNSDYRKIPKYSDSQNIAVIILKFEQCGSTIKLGVQKLQTEWQTV